MSCALQQLSSKRFINSCFWGIEIQWKKKRRRRGYDLYYTVDHFIIRLSPLFPFQRQLWKSFDFFLFFCTLIELYFSLVTYLHRRRYFFISRYGRDVSLCIHCLVPSALFEWCTEWMYPLYSRDWKISMKNQSSKISSLFSFPIFLLLYLVCKKYSQWIE